VTGRINTYVTEKGLKAGQNITLDATLQDLLQPPEGTQITFLNIQKYINPHYIKDPTTEKKPREKKAKAEPVGAGDASPDASPPKEKKVRPKVAKAPAS
jgi:hypothetical protein